ncbi:hypothetical protein EG329_005157 [Mollisiaceae sp. DMI_Dod_QoI]|nr:hypothetical protein EG329_005157 [Helotiales sp. DMI_Dod_QoI]
MAEETDTFKTAQDFPQFALLPLELRRVIWGFAAAGWTQDIHFSITNPKEAWEDNPFERRKHLFASELSCPSLLYACHDSRAAALEHYTLGLNIEAKNAWSWRAAHFSDDEYRECPYDAGLQEAGRRTYWAPGNDIVVLEHGEEPYLCDSTSICNSMPNRRHEYKLDERIKYIAITMDLWNNGTADILLDVPGLDVLFVLIERKPCFAFAGFGQYDFKGIQEESCRILEKQMTAAVRSDSALFRLKRRLVTSISVEVALVVSIDELIEKMIKRRKDLELP